MPLHSADHARLHPQHLAQELQALCQDIPGWPYGAVGIANTLRLTATALRRPEGNTLRAGRELALFAWGEYPLNEQLLHIVTHLYIHQSGQSGQVGQAGQQATSALPELDSLLEFLASRKNKEGAGEQGARTASALSPQPPLSALSPLSLLLQARLHAQDCLLADPASADSLHALRALQELLPPLEGKAHPWNLWLGTALAQYHCLHRQFAEARAALWPVWARCPCHPNVLLALYELVAPTVPEAAEGQVSGKPPALLMYSWNKAAVLAQTLQSLRASDLDHAPLFVLDNGSSDDTAALLSSQQDLWGGQLRCIRLPVNIGAPAARNWLLSLPEVRAHENVVFLDDDLLLDTDWLRTLRRVAAAHPQADTIGCRIVGHEKPYPTQCADFFLLPPKGCTVSFADLQEHMHLHCAAMDSTQALFSRYTRPCLSVSGCCHWLRTRSLDSIGLFDPRFSPSQFDDAERDLRTLLCGGTVLYTGLVRVRHVQHSSLKQAQDRARSAHIFGNKIKLEFLYDASKVEGLRLHTENLARQDIVRKITRLAALYPRNLHE